MGATAIRISRLITDQTDTARELGVPQNRISDILRGRRGITADTALRLARYLNTTPEVWLNLQKAYELRVAELESGKDIARKVKPRQEAA